MYVCMYIVGWKDCSVSDKNIRDQEAATGLWSDSAATFPLSLLMYCVFLIMMYHAMCSAVYIVALSVSIHQAAVAGEKAVLTCFLPDATAAHLGYEAQVLLLLTEGVVVHS